MNFREELAVAGELELTDSELEMVYGGTPLPGGGGGGGGEGGGEGGGREGGGRERFRGEGGGEGFGFDDYPWGWPEYYERPFPWWLRRRYRDWW